jgi:hypothetical protein
MRARRGWLAGPADLDFLPVQLRGDMQDERPYFRPELEQDSSCSGRAVPGGFLHGYCLSVRLVHDGRSAGGQDGL